MKALKFVSWIILVLVAIMTVAAGTSSNPVAVIGPINNNEIRRGETDTHRLPKSGNGGWQTFKTAENVGTTNRTGRALARQFLCHRR